MRLMVCVLGSIAIGCASYLLGAIVWSIVDPPGASKSLLFTIPIAIAGVTVPAVLAMMGAVYVARSGTSRRRKRVRTHAPRPEAAPEAIDLDDLRFAA